jgi:hypothetical protein
MWLRRPPIPTKLCFRRPPFTAQSCSHWCAAALLLWQGHWLDHQRYRRTLPHGGNQGEDTMITNVILIFIASLLMIGVAEAQVRTVTKTGPNGKALALKMDGKYSTCLRDGQRLGYSLDSATRYCDAKPNLKR